MTIGQIAILAIGTLVSGLLGRHLRRTKGGSIISLAVFLAAFGVAIALGSGQSPMLFLAAGLVGLLAGGAIMVFSSRNAALTWIVALAFLAAPLPASAQSPQKALCCRPLTLALIL